MTTRSGLKLLELYVNAMWWTSKLQVAASQWKKFWPWSESTHTDGPLVPTYRRASFLSWTTRSSLKVGVLMHPWLFSAATCPGPGCWMVPLHQVFFASWPNAAVHGPETQQVWLSISSLLTLTFGSLPLYIAKLCSKAHKSRWYIRSVDRFQKMVYASMLTTTVYFFYWLT